MTLKLADIIRYPMYLTAVYLASFWHKFLIMINQYIVNFNNHNQIWDGTTRHRKNSRIKEAAHTRKPSFLTKKYVKLSDAINTSRAASNISFNKENSGSKYVTLNSSATVRSNSRSDNKNFIKLNLNCIQSKRPLNPKRSISKGCYGLPIKRAKVAKGKLH